MRRYEVYWLVAEDEQRKRTVGYRLNLKRSFVELRIKCVVVFVVVFYLRKEVIGETRWFESHGRQMTIALGG